LESILGLLKSLKTRAQVERIDHNRQEATLELPQGRFSQDLILHIIQVRIFKAQSLENFFRDCLDTLLTSVCRSFSNEVGACKKYIVIDTQ
jgi:hypothetical protein